MSGMRLKLHSVFIRQTSLGFTFNGMQQLSLGLFSVHFFRILIKWYAAAAALSSILRKFGLNEATLEFLS